MEQRGVFPLVPIKNVDVYAAVRQRLTELIEHGGYNRGDRLPAERQLADALGVSRIAVREGLKVLESAGRVEIRRGAGAFVVYPGADPIAANLAANQTIDKPFLAHLIDARAAIEEKVVGLAAERATDGDLDSLSAVVKRNEEELPESSEPGSLNLLFEAELGRIARSPLLERLQRAVHELWVDSWSDAGLTPDHKNILHAEHVKILDAVRRRDVPGAITAMAQHVDRELPDEDTDMTRTKEPDE